MVPVPVVVPILSGDGIRLRPFALGDVDAVMEVAADPVIPRLTTVPDRPDRDLAGAFVERQHRRATSGEGLSWAIEDSGGSAAGQIGLWLRDLEQGRANIGYWLRPSVRGRGLATRALTTVVAWAWQTHDLHRLELHVEPDNVGSIRVAERVGFVPEGRLRSWLSIAGERRDVVLYALLRP